jgi:hypothetical protein
VIAKVQSDIQEEEAAAAAELAAARSKARDLEQQVHTQYIYAIPGSNHVASSRLLQNAAHESA